MLSKTKPLVLIGGGGHASVLADILLGQGRDILAVISPKDVSSRNVFSGILHLNNDYDVRRFPSNEVLLVNGIGAVPRSSFRERISQYFLELGYKFETVISSKAMVSEHAMIKSGVQVLPGASVQTGAIICDHSIINTGAVVEHDCDIGAYCHIAPNATVCGGVRVEDNVYIGANSTVLQGLKLERSSVVGAGATLTKDLSFNMTAYPSKVEVKD